MNNKTQHQEFHENLWAFPWTQLCIPHRFSWFQAQAMDAMVNIAPQPPIQLQQAATKAGNKKRLLRPKKNHSQNSSQAALWDIKMCKVVWLGDSDSDDGSGRDQERYLLQAISAACNLMADDITVEWIRK